MVKPVLSTVDSAGYHKQSLGIIAENRLYSRQTTGLYASLHWLTGKLTADATCLYKG